MKGLFFVGFIFLGSFIFSETSQPTSFFGVPWESSKQQAESILKSKQVKYTSDDNDSLILNIDSFGSYQVEFVKMIFFQNKLCQGKVIFVPNELNFILIYNNLEQELIEKYSEPSEKNRDWGPGFVAGMEYQNSQLGPVHVNTAWDFPKNTMPPTYSINLSIRLMEKYHPFIEIEYSYFPILFKMMNAQKSEF